MAIFYLDPEGGNDANDGTTFANRWKTVTTGASAARIAAGDTIRIIGSPPKTSVGVNGTFTNLTETITLASALNVLITDCETNWTASANVTATTNASRKSGSFSVNLAIAAGFTTGKAAYFDLGSNQDYSAYQGITFWLETNAAIAASVLQIKLCSDTIGDVAVDTFNIPQCHNAGGTVWIPIYIDKGSALGSAIRSIALYAASDPGTITVKLDNISTVKAKGASQTDNLNLTSLIGATSTGLLYPIRSISGTTVKVDQRPDQFLGATAGRGWAGTTGSYAVYKQETVRYEMSAGLFGLQLTIQDSGAAGTPITFSGGWNRSDMSVQDSETWIDGTHGYCVGWGNSGAKNYITFEKINMVRWYHGWSNVSGATNWVFNGTVRGAACNQYLINLNAQSYTTIGNVEAAGMGVGTIALASCYKTTIGNVTAHGGGTNFTGAYGLTLTTSNRFLSVGNCDIRNTYWYGIYYDDLFSAKFGTLLFRNIDNNPIGNTSLTPVLGRVTFGDIDCDAGAAGILLPYVNQNHVRYGTIMSKNGTTGVKGHPGPTSFVKSIVTSGNSSYGWGMPSSSMMPSGGRVKTTNITDSTKYSESGYASVGKPTNHWTSCRNYENVADAHRVEYGGPSTPTATITVETGANRHTASGKGWKLAVLNAAYTSTFPFRHCLGQIYVEASALVTLRLYINRSNLNLVVQLVQPLIQIGGVTTDVVDSASGSASTWEELEITFTPNESGIIKPELRAYATDGVTTYTCYFDDMTIGQA